MNKHESKRERSLLTKVLGRSILTFTGTVRLYRNQRRIIKISKKEKLLLIEVDNHVGTGISLKNHFHFFFDLILPLYYLIENTDDDVFFIVKLDAYFDKAKLLLPKRVIFIKNNANNIPENIGNTYCVRMLGMNTKVIFLKKTFLERLKQNIFLQLNIETTNNCKKVLLIERVKPSETPSNKSLEYQNYYNTTFSRVIVNHDELKSKLESLVGSHLEFHNLHLETLSIQDQMKYFDNAAIVIAQHGAGLTNCLWMRANTILIELNNNDSFRHYRYMCRQKSVVYYEYKTSALHVNIDVNHFSSWFLSIPKIQKVLERPSKRVET